MRSGGHPLAPDFDDNVGDGFGRRSAHYGFRGGRFGALQHGSRHRNGAGRRNALHAICRAGDVHAYRRRSPRQETLATQFWRRPKTISEKRDANTAGNGAYCSSHLRRDGSAFLNYLVTFTDGFLRRFNAAQQKHPSLTY
jgi:hypothetical protein